MHRGVGLVLAAGVLAAGCATTPPRQSASISKPSPVELSPDPAPVVVTPVAVVHKKKPTRNPLTGLAPRKVPLVVIKVDNASTSRPFQRGINHATVVYQELVESGPTTRRAPSDPLVPVGAGAHRLGLSSDEVPLS